MAKRKIKTTDFLEILESDDYQDVLIDKRIKHNDVITAISTGCLSLDISTGIGGIPVGKFTELYGAESSGKTTLALGIAREAIKSGKRVLYNDPEQGLDLAYASAIIGEDAYDKDKFVLVQPELLEQALNICELAIESGSFGLIILDSIASMVPKKVKEESLGDSHVAVLARIYGQFLSRNLYSVRTNNVAFLGINQVRDKFGSYFATYETPGGHEWKHITSMRIMLSKSKDITQGEKKIGILTKFVIKKNKLAPPYRTFLIPLMFGTGVDFYRDVIDFSVLLGVIKKGGAYYKYNDATLASGLVGTVEYLRNNPDTLDSIVKECYNIANNMLVTEGVDDYGESVED